MNWLIRMFGIRHNATPVPSNDVPDGIKAVLSAAWDRFNIQWNGLDIIDQKASTLLAIIGVMVTILVTLGPDNTSGAAFWIRLAGVSILLISATIALFAYRVRVYKVPAHPKELLDYYYRSDLTDPDKQTTEMLIEHLDDIIKANNKSCDRKVLLLNTAYAFLIAGMFLIVIAYGLS